MVLYSQLFTLFFPQYPLGSLLGTPLKDGDNTNIIKGYKGNGEYESINEN